MTNFYVDDLVNITQPHYSPEPFMGFGAFDLADI